MVGNRCVGGQWAVDGHQSSVHRCGGRRLAKGKLPIAGINPTNGAYEGVGQEMPVEELKIRRRWPGHSAFSYCYCPEGAISNKAVCPPPNCVVSVACRHRDRHQAARAVYFMLKNKTVFNPERLVAVLQKAA